MPLQEGSPDYILLGSQVVTLPHSPSRPSQGPRGNLPGLSWVGEWVTWFNLFRLPLSYQESINTCSQHQTFIHNAAFEEENTVASLNNAHFIPIWQYFCLLLGLGWSDHGYQIWPGLSNLGSWWWIEGPKQDRRIIAAERLTDLASSQDSTSKLSTSGKPFFYASQTINSRPTPLFAWGYKG